MTDVSALLAYAHVAAASVRSRAQYPVSFALDLVGSFVAGVTDFVVILVLFTHLPRLAGWSLPQVAFLYGLAGTSFGLTDTLVGHLDNFGDEIRFGTFDVTLVRPLDSLLQAMAAELQVRRLGKVGQAAAVLGYGIASAHIDWTPARALMLPVALVSGTALFCGVWIAGASLSFWTTEIREVVNSLTYGGNALTSYPITIFGDWLRRFLAFVVPLAFVAYYPSLLILGRPDPVLGRPWLGFLSPVVGLLTLAAGRGAWRLGVRRYRSTGS